MISVPRHVRQRLITSTVLMNPSGRVTAGPFKGMRLNWTAYGSSFYPKALGTYEMELSGVLDTIIGTIRPKQILDIGAAEGFYAVGLALRMPETRIIAFEIEPEASRLLRQTIALNGVQGRVEVLGGCDPESLERSIAAEPRTVIICDVEGYEKQLLDPSAVRGLDRVDVLVEVHEHLAEGVREALETRFAGSHEITQIPCHLDRSRYRPAAVPYWDLLPSGWRFRLTNERMVETPWFWMRARSRAVD